MPVVIMLTTILTESSGTMRDGEKEFHGLQD